MSPDKLNLDSRHIRLDNLRGTGNLKFSFWISLHATFQMLYLNNIYLPYVQWTSSLLQFWIQATSSLQSGRKLKCSWHSVAHTCQSSVHFPTQIYDRSRSLKNQGNFPFSTGNDQPTGSLDPRTVVLVHNRCHEKLPADIKAKFSHFSFSLIQFFSKILILCFNSEITFANILTFSE